MPRLSDYGVGASGDFRNGWLTVRLAGSPADKVGARRDPPHFVQGPTGAADARPTAGHSRSWSWSQTTVLR
jgi:hypothetical protein